MIMRRGELFRKSVDLVEDPGPDRGHLPPGWPVPGCMNMHRPNLVTVR
jgi:hypothetical protein